MRGNIGHTRRRPIDYGKYTVEDGEMIYKDDFQGVSYDPRYRKPHRAIIKHNKKRYDLGRFDTPHEAAAVYQAALKMILAGEWEE